MPDLADVRLSLGGIGAVTGIVQTTVSAGVCTVRIADVDATVRVARDLTVAVGDVLLIVRQGSARWAIARLYTAAPPAPPENDPAPDPKPVTVSGQLVVPPVYTGSFRDGKWRTDDLDMFQGRHSSSSFGINTGAAFYGSKPRSLAGSTVTRARIKVRRIEAGVYGIQTAHPVAGHRGDEAVRGTHPNLVDYRAVAGDQHGRRVRHPRLVGAGHGRRQLGRAGRARIRRLPVHAVRGQGDPGVRVDPDNRLEKNGVSHGRGDH